MIKKRWRVSHFPPFKKSSSSSYNLFSICLHNLFLESNILLSTTGLLLLCFSLHFSQTKFSTSFFDLSTRMGSLQIAHFHSISPAVFSYNHLSTTLSKLGSYIRFRYWDSILSKSFENLCNPSCLSLSLSAIITMSGYMVLSSW